MIAHGGKQNERKPRGPNKENKREHLAGPSFLEKILQ